MTFPEGPQISTTPKHRPRQKIDHAKLDWPSYTTHPFVHLEYFQIY